jgi:hypothetical protein
LDWSDSLWSWCEYSQGAWFRSPCDISTGHASDFALKMKSN